MLKHLVLCILLASTCGLAQSNNPETLPTGYKAYQSVGFNASSVSGLGLSYRSHPAGPNQIQFTGGIVSSESSTSYSLGLEYQYQLSKKDSFRYYIASGIGTYSGTTSTTTIGFGIGLEVPFIGTVIYESVTAGASLFYPVFYVGNQPSISFGGSLYIFYNL